MAKWMRRLAVPFSLLAAAGTAGAAGVPWTDHARPYTFTFGNEIDTHQQTRASGSGELSGFLYVAYTGETTADGLPVATHADCNQVPCTVGWMISGKAGTGTFLYHVPGDHPVWLVERSAIPQPGAFSHFHWLGSRHPQAGDPPAAGYFLQLLAIDRFCFVHEGATPLAPGNCRDAGGTPVTPGVDVATHTNIVASFPDR